MKLKLTIEIWEKGNWYLAKTPELDFISQGRTQEEAKKNLLEVIKYNLKKWKKCTLLMNISLNVGLSLNMMVR
ncbi:MAG: hypothetical protein AB1422_02665 [bacterium]